MVGTTILGLFCAFSFLVFSTTSAMFTLQHFFSAILHETAVHRDAAAGERAATSVGLSPQRWVQHYIQFRRRQPHLPFADQLLMFGPPACQLYACTIQLDALVLFVNAN